MDAPASEGLALWQWAAILIALALVVGGALWFRAHWRTHDLDGRPRPPGGSA